MRTPPCDGQRRARPWCAEVVPLVTLSLVVVDALSGAVSLDLEKYERCVQYKDMEQLLLRASGLLKKDYDKLRMIVQQFKQICRDLRNHVEQRFRES